MWGWVPGDRPGWSRGGSQAPASWGRDRPAKSTLLDSVMVCVAVSPLPRPLLITLFTVKPTYCRKSCWMAASLLRMSSVREGICSPLCSLLATAGTLLSVGHLSSLTFFLSSTSPFKWRKKLYIFHLTNWIFSLISDFFFTYFEKFQTFYRSSYLHFPFFLSHTCCPGLSSYSKGSWYRKKTPLPLESHQERKKQFWLKQSLPLSKQTETIARAAHTDSWRINSIFFMHFQISNNIPRIQSWKNLDMDTFHF